MAFQHILVPIDGSETANLAFAKAADIAKAFNSKLTLVQVMTLDPYITAEYVTAAQTNDMIERARTSIQASLHDARAKIASYGLEVNTLLLEGQTIHSEIVKAAEDLHIDLIVIGSHGRTGFKKFFLGSVAQTLLTATDIPILVVRK